MTNRDIAYKQASASPQVKGVLPDDFITEWTYVDLHPPGTLKAADGWQFSDESEFMPRWHSNGLLLRGER